MSSGLTTVEILSFPCGPYRTNAYIVLCRETSQAAIIDPSSRSFNKIAQALQERQSQATKLILTHSHWDHIADASLFVEHMQLPVFIHQEDVDNLIHPGSDGLPYFVPIHGVQPTQFLADQEVFSIGNSSWQVIHTPGHSPGSICLHCAKEGLLISGDTLFKGSFGSVSLPTGQPERMWSSLKKLASLPEATRVFPGHGPSTSIGQEKGWMEHAQELL